MLSETETLNASVICAGVMVNDSTLPVVSEVSETGPSDDEA